MNGVIETATGNLLRAGFGDMNDSAFDAGTESIRNDVPEPPMVKYQLGNTLMHQWDGVNWITVANPQRKEAPEGLIADSGGAAFTIDVKQATAWEITLDADVTFGFVGADTSRAWSFTLRLVQDGVGGWLVTWPAGITWAGGTPPTLSTGIGEIDVLTFVTMDGGTTWDGFLAGADQS